VGRGPASFAHSAWLARSSASMPPGPSFVFPIRFRGGLGRCLALHSIAPHHATADELMVSPGDGGSHVFLFLFLPRGRRLHRRQERSKLDKAAVHARV
jgi:hypothetical protein